MLKNRKSRSLWRRAVGFCHRAADFYRRAVDSCGGMPIATSSRRICTRAPPAPFSRTNSSGRRTAVARFSFRRLAIKALRSPVARPCGGSCSNRSKLGRFSSGSAVYTYTPSPGQTEWTTDQYVTDWVLQGQTTPTYWHQGAEADFPQLGSPGSQYSVNISGAGSQGLVYASKIEIASGSNYLFTGDQLEIPGSVQGTPGTQIVVNQNTGDTTNLAISSAMVNPSGETAEGVQVSGGGTLTVSGTNNYSGGTVLNLGSTLNVNSNAALGDPNAPLTFSSDATLQAASSMTLESLVGTAEVPRNIVIAANTTATIDTDGAIRSRSPAISATSAAPAPCSLSTARWATRVS